MTLKLIETITRGNQVSSLYGKLSALQEKAKDLVAEASVPTELATSLDNLFKFVGLSWSNKLPALPPANESKRSNKTA